MCIRTLALTFVATALTLCAGAVGQSPVSVATPGSPRPPGDRPADRGKTTPQQISLATYDAERSRGTFSSCDAGADDRLDLFEARAAMQDLGSRLDPSWFRRLDTDRDGFLEWPEFDRFYRHVVQDGGTLHLRLVRALPAAQEMPPAASVAPRRTVDLFDTNRDGELDLAEGQAMLRELGVPADLIGMAPMLDRDQNGKYSEQELSGAMQQFHIDLFSPLGSPSAGAAGKGLAAPWSGADQNRDQAIDAVELATLLRRIDPQLDRWSTRLLTVGDRDKSGRLEATELPAAAAKASPPLNPAPPAK